MAGCWLGVFRRREQSCEERAKAGHGALLVPVDLHRSVAFGGRCWDWGTGADRRLRRPASRAPRRSARHRGAHSERGEQAGPHQASGGSASPDANKPQRARRGGIVSESGQFRVNARHHSSPLAPTPLRSKRRCTSSDAGPAPGEHPPSAARRYRLLRSMSRGTGPNPRSPLRHPKDDAVCATVSFMCDVCHRSRHVHQFEMSGEGRPPPTCTSRSRARRGSVASEVISWWSASGIPLPP